MAGTRPAAVSVVIPFFRAQTTIKRAVASVAAQTLPVREVIVVDDASGPVSADALDKLGQAWPHLQVRIVTLPSNQGAAAARNMGWDQAAGEFVAFLDADDAWHPRKIELQISLMRQHPGTDLCGHGHVVAPAGQSSADDTALPENSPAVRRIHRFEMLSRNPFVTPSVMVKAGGQLRFTQGQRHMEDHGLWMRMALEGYEIMHMDAALATLFKPSIGAGGLSGDIMKMQLADMGNYLALRREGRIGLVETTGWLVWSVAKFFRRLLRLGWMSLAGRRGVGRMQA